MAPRAPIPIVDVGLGNSTYPHDLGGSQAAEHAAGHDPGAISLEPGTTGAGR